MNNFYSIKIEGYVVLCSILFFFNACMSSTAESKKEQPNIVLILADDLGYADLGCYGSKQVLSPNIDKLSKEGIRFTNAYVNASICTPSRAGLLTGRYPQRFGIEKNSEDVLDFGLDSLQYILPQALQTEGYTTIGTGKWDLGQIPSAQPWTRGFDFFSGFYVGCRSYFIDYEQEVKHKAFKDYRDNPDEIKKVKGYVTDIMTDDAIKDIDKVDEETPWFLYLSYTCPHWPLEAKEEDLARFPDIKNPDRKTFLAMMYSMDENIGKLISYLEESDQMDNTLIVFLSDNGGPTGHPRIKAPRKKIGKNTSLNVPLKGFKGQLYEGGIRVPFVMKWDNVLAQNRVVDDVVSSLDLFPTLLKFAKGELKEEYRLDGKDLSSYLTKDNIEIPSRKLFWKQKNNIAIRDGDWKLIRQGKKDFSLYDLKNDISEQTDLKDVEKEKYDNLKKELIIWLNSLNSYRYSAI